MRNVHQVTKDFEQAICDYTGAPYCVAVDNQSNALFLCLQYVGIEGVNITIPSHTYMSVPQEIKHCGGSVTFKKSDKFLEGAYQLHPTLVYDSALLFTADMYLPGTFMCLSFTGPYKTLKLGKGGAILLDDEKAYKWLKKARFSGRDECSYFEDDFDVNPVIGWNFYMNPIIATLGLHMMPQFYNSDGTKKHNPPLKLPYPDLSKFELWK